MSATMTEPIREQQPRRPATGMPGSAKAFVGTTILAGLVTMAIGLRQLESANTAKFVCYLVLALLASTCKVRLPKLTGTISVNFLFILIGIADLSLPETLVLGAAATLLQCFWKAQQWPSPVQVAFNVAALGISSTVAYTVPRVILASVHGESSLPTLLAMATVLFFLTNTLLVSTVLALLENKPVSAIWRQCYMWSLPYYMIGAAIAALVAFESRTVGWTVSLLILPLMYLVYQYYSMFVKQATQDSQTSPLSA